MDRAVVPQTYAIGIILLRRCSTSDRSSNLPRGAPVAAEIIAKVRGNGGVNLGSLALALLGLGLKLANVGLASTR